MKVVVNAAMSLDGRLASASRERKALGTWADRAWMSVLRARADAILVGGNTFRTWTLPLVPDPAAITRLAEAGFPDVEHPSLEGRCWWNVVISRSLELPTTGRFYEDPRVQPLFFSPSNRDVPAEVVRGEVTVDALLAELERRGVRTLLVEGGGGMIDWLLRAGAVDELCITLCPLVLGAGPSLVEGAGWSVGDAPRWRLMGSFGFGGELYVKYGRA